MALRSRLLTGLAPVAIALALPGAATAAVDVATVVTDSPDPVPRGQIVTYQVFFSSTGGNDAPNTTCDLQWNPSQFDFVEASVTLGPMTIGPVSPGDVDCSIGTFPSGGNRQMTVKLRSKLLGSWAVTSNISTTGDSDLANNTDTETVVVGGIVASPPALGFGGTAMGLIGPTQTVTVTNEWNTQVTISKLAISGIAAGDYLVTADDCTGRMLPVMASCPFGVRFAPSATGARDATLTVNATAGPVFPIPLSGEGTDAPAGPPGPEGPAGPQGPPAFKLVVVPVNKRLAARVGRRVTFTYVSTLGADVLLEVLKNGTAKTSAAKVIASVKGRAREGLNRIRWNARRGRRAARAGRYTLRLTATAGDQRAVIQASLRLIRR